MEFYVKNMVCERCIQVLEKALEEAGVALVSIELGRLLVRVQDGKGMDDTIENILSRHGFSLVKDPDGLLVERVKQELIRLLHALPLQMGKKLSAYLSERLHQEYSGISKTFSRREQQTIEKYFIKLKIEKAKELLQDPSHNFTEIAQLLDYSSSNHLSSQFKNETGMSLSYYRQMKRNTRKGLDQIL